MGHYSSTSQAQFTILGRHIIDVYKSLRDSIFNHVEGHPDVLPEEFAHDWVESEFRNNGFEIHTTKNDEYLCKNCEKWTICDIYSRCPAKFDDGETHEFFATFAKYVEPGSFIEFEDETCQSMWRYLFENGEVRIVYAEITWPSFEKGHKIEVD